MYNKGTKSIKGNTPKEYEMEYIENDKKWKIIKIEEGVYCVTYYEKLNGKWHNYDKGERCDKTFVADEFGKEFAY